VTEYETAEGAAAGFAYLEDERAIISATDVPLDQAIGEQSELTSERGTGNADGRIFRSLDLTFRIGNLVAGVTLTQYATADRIDPDPELVQALAGLMADRVASPVSGSSPGAQVVRIEDTAHEIVTFDDAYYRLGGEDIPLGGESADGAALRIETYAGAEHVYQLWQGIDAAEPAGALYGVTLLQFRDTAAAEAWTTELAEILATNPFYGDIRKEAAAKMIGDQTVVLSYATGGGGAANPRALLIAVRAGSTVARVHLVPQGVLAEVSMDALTALARAQADCLQGADCAATVAVPDELSEGLATAAAPDSSPVASPQANR
jgi:hypothetical protein